VKTRRRPAHEPGISTARRRSAFAFALVMVSACAHPAAPSAGGAPDRSHDDVTAHDASDGDERAPASAASSTAPPHAEAPDSGDPRAPAAAAAECDVFDPRNPACKAVCPKDGSLVNGDACRHCPTPPDPDHVACQRTMPCPDPPDRRVWACMPHRRPVDDGSRVARVLKIDTTPDGLVLVFSAGLSHGVDKRWSATVLVGDTDTPLAGGDVELIRIDKNASYGKVHLTTDQLGPNNRVRLTRP